MCLSSISETFEGEEKNRKVVGYKAVRKHKNHDNKMCYSCAYLWCEADNKEIQEEKDKDYIYITSTKRYKLGFHVFTNLRDAQVYGEEIYNKLSFCNPPTITKWTIIKVELTDLVCRGLQEMYRCEYTGKIFEKISMECVVGREMRIIEEVQEI